MLKISQIHSLCGQFYSPPSSRCFLLTSRLRRSYYFGTSQTVERSSRSLSKVARAAILTREEKASLMKGVQQDHLDIAARAIDQALSASSKWTVSHTDFLTPPAQQDIKMVLDRLSDVNYVVSGGYSQAERCRISMGNSESVEFLELSVDERGFPGAVSAVEVSGRFDFESASHKDFLGSVLGTGITREKVGDIIVKEILGAQIILVPELVDFVVSAMTSVGKVSVTVKPIDISEIQSRELKVEVLKTVESSLRVDAVASAGFKTSRTKLGDLIDSGLVKVNWREVTKGGFVLKSGDIVSVRGKGRIEIGEVSVSKKGKYVVEITRYT